MSFETVGLGKLLATMYASPRDRTAALRRDITQEIRKASGANPSKGGDFYIPFWADAKLHVGGGNLRELTPGRIAKNDTRRRLYPLLQSGFLSWWEERRRRRNEPFTVINEQVHGRLVMTGLGTIKVENTLWFRVGDDGDRIVYPYFCEDPALSAEAARLGLWVMSECLTGQAPEAMRILDVFAGRSFSLADSPFAGNEEDRFRENYAQVLSDWATLRLEYD